MAPRVIVEVKTAHGIDNFHVAQVRHYLKATSLEVGLLLNFGRRAEFRRVILENSQKRRVEDSGMSESDRPAAQ